MKVIFYLFVIGYGSSFVWVRVYVCWRFFLVEVIGVGGGFYIDFLILFFLLWGGGSFL